MDVVKKTSTENIYAIVQASLHIQISKKEANLYLEYNNGETLI